MLSLHDEIQKALYGDSLPSAHVHRANFSAHKMPDGTIKIRRYQGIRFVVHCDLCEFVRPCTSRHEAESIRIAHLSTAHSDDVLAGKATYHLIQEMPS